jgi:hypothetical protein
MNALTWHRGGEVTVEEMAGLCDAGDIRGHQPIGVMVGVGACGVDLPEQGYP